MIRRSSRAPSGPTVPTDCSPARVKTRRRGTRSDSSVPGSRDRCEHGVEPGAVGQAEVDVGARRRRAGVRPRAASRCASLADSPRRRGTRRRSRSRPAPRSTHTCPGPLTSTSVTSGRASSGSSGPAPCTSRSSASWTASTVASPTGRPWSRSASATRCGVSCGTAPSEVVADGGQDVVRAAAAEARPADPLCPPRRTGACSAPAPAGRRGPEPRDPTAPVRRRGRSPRPAPAGRPSSRPPAGRAAARRLEPPLRPRHRGAPARCPDHAAAAARPGRRRSPPARSASRPAGPGRSGPAPLRRPGRRSAARRPRPSSNPRCPADSASRTANACRLGVRSTGQVSTESRSRRGSASRSDRALSRPVACMRASQRMPSTCSSPSTRSIPGPERRRRRRPACCPKRRITWARAAANTVAPTPPAPPTTPTVRPGAAPPSPTSVSGLDQPGLRGGQSGDGLCTERECVAEQVVGKTARPTTWTRARRGGRAAGEVGDPIGTDQDQRSRGPRAQAPGRTRARSPA